MRSLRTYLGLVLVVAGFVFFVVFFREMVRVTRLVFVLDDSTVPALRAENARLRDEMARLVSGATPFTVLQEHLSVAAGVYSRYPFNDRRTVVVDFGTEYGAAVGMPVLVEEGVLFGRLSSVRSRQSEVETLYSNSWTSSVLVGSSSVEAVLRGGRQPRLELIPRDTAIEPGDLVRSASPEFPLGAPVGVVLSVSGVVEEFLQSVLVEPFFDIDAVRGVYILTDFDV
jgi:cell shape-determining protein MreC